MAASKSPKKAKSKKAKKTQNEARAPKLSALEAAVKALAETGKPMSCNEMIETMAAKGYWSSPGGKTPASTLYSAILKEISTKGKESRFRKTDRGQFARA
jgi:HB1, ASXL, restriction endonuclease HTH domain